jgi:hypothetical protein
LCIKQGDFWVIGYGSLSKKEEAKGYFKCVLSVHLGKIVLFETKNVFDSVVLKTIIYIDKYR